MKLKELLDLIRGEGDLYFGLLIVLRKN